MASKVVLVIVKFFQSRNHLADIGSKYKTRSLLKPVMKYTENELIQMHKDHNVYRCKYKINVNRVLKWVYSTKV